MKIALIILIFTVCNFSGATSLYEVEVAVESQNSVDRERGVEEALRLLLVRVTGLKSVPQNELVAQAYLDPGNWQTSYGYIIREELDPQGMVYSQTYLVVNFERELILRLVREAGLPVWLSDRPRLLAWIVNAEHDGERTILSDASNIALTQFIQKRSRVRGITIELPLFDLEERNQLSPSMITGGFDELIVQLSKRYSPDHVILGYVFESPEGNLKVLWRSPAKDDTQLYGVEAKTLDLAATKLVDHMADETMQRSVLFHREFHTISISVTGIKGVESYMRVLSYLESMEFVDEVLITRVASNQIDFRVKSPYSKERFNSLTGREGQLVLKKPSVNVSDKQVFVWRGKH